ncbi:MAG: histidine kinase [Candidatus Delongbacteria bacterium]|nr:histidine kinase [Candidatus Delongbacteria bacterium]MBN2833924.1 histidine kinase [Candidatus Delongbacteria bacterium]
MKKFILLILILLTVLFSGTEKKETKAYFNFAMMDSIQNIIDTSENDTLKIKGYLELYNIFTKKKMYSKSVEYLYKCYDLSKQLNFYEYIFKSGMLLSDYYKMNGLYGKAINTYNELLSIYGNDNQAYITIILLKKLSMMPFSEYDQAIELIKKLETLIDYRKDYDKYFDMRAIEARFLREKKDFSNSLKIYKDLEDKVQYASKPYLYKSTIITNIGDSYELLGDFENSEKYYKEAVKLTESPSGIIISYINLSSIAKYQEKYEECKNYLDKAMQIAEEHKVEYLKRQIYLYYIGLYSAKKEHLKALEYLNEFNTLNEQSYLNTDSVSIISNIEYNLGLEKREIEMENERNSLRYQKNILITTSTILILVILLFYLFYSRKMKENRIKQLALIKEKMNSELKSIQSRINPHFLFNSLSSLLSLVSIDVKGAETMIISLSNLLRYTLNVSKKDLVKLSEEMEIVEKYLQIEKFRLGRRLSYNIGDYESLKNFTIPPLIIQPLVENSLKHGISNNIDGGEVEISLSCRNNNLSIIVKDTNKAENNSLNGGFGLDNIRKRLNILYKGKASLNILSLEGVSIELLIPCGCNSEG